MKLCKDCKWSYVDSFGDRFMECRAPGNIVGVGREPVTALINGTMLYDESETRYRFTYCSSQRMYLIPWLPSTCGKIGRWFERSDAAQHQEPTEK